MSAISISIGLLIALVTILLLDRMRKLPKIAGYGSHRMPVLRIDYTSIKGVLLGVWQVSIMCDPNSREIERKVVTTVSQVFESSGIRSMKR